MSLRSDAVLAIDEPRAESPTSPEGTRPRPWRIFLDTASLIAGGLLAFVAVAAIALAVSSHLSPAPEVLSHPVMAVLSGSMTPAIRTGDLVVDDKLTPAQAADLHPGQIISFRANAGHDVIFTHRIAAVVHLPDGSVAYVTKGDANASRDVPLAASTSVIGLFQSRIPAGGYVLNDLHRPLVIGLLLAAPLLWLLAEPLWRWARTEDGAPTATETRG